MGVPEWMKPADFQMCLDPLISGYRESQTQLLDRRAVERLLYECDREGNLADFVRDYTFGLSSPRGGAFSPLSVKDGCEVLRDARRLISLVIRLKALLDGHGGTCTKEDLAEIGVRACTPPLRDIEVANVYVILESPELLTYLRDCNRAEAAEATVLNWMIRMSPDGTLGSMQAAGLPYDPLTHRSPMPSVAPTTVSGKEIKTRGMFLPEQAEAAAELEDDRYYCVIGFYGGELALDDPDCSPVVSRLITMIMDRCRAQLRSLPTPSETVFAGKDSWSELWFRVWQALEDSVAIPCRCCGRPFLAQRKKGLRREYCSAACKSRVIRSRRYWRLTRLDGKGSAEAAKVARISAGLAEEIIGRDPALFE